MPHYPLHDTSQNIIGYLRPDPSIVGDLRMVKLPEPEMFGRLQMA